jgi:hypothetical protein
LFKTDYDDCAVFKIRAYKSYTNTTANVPINSTNGQAYLKDAVTDKDLTTGKIAPVIKTTVTDYTSFSIYLVAHTQGNDLPISGPNITAE